VQHSGETDLSPELHQGTTGVGWIRLGHSGIWGRSHGCLVEGDPVEDRGGEADFHRAIQRTAQQLDMLQCCCAERLPESADSGGKVVVVRELYPSELLKLLAESVAGVYDREVAEVVYRSKGDAKVVLELLLTIVQRLLRVARRLVRNPIEQCGQAPLFPLVAGLAGHLQVRGRLPGRHDPAAHLLTDRRTGPLWHFCIMILRGVQAATQIKTRFSKTKKPPFSGGPRIVLCLMVPQWD
jgi:hypothetical protein